MAFISGGIISGLIWAIIIYLSLKGRYEKEISEAYHRGYKNGSYRERRAILDYIDELNGKTVEGSEDNAQD